MTSASAPEPLEPAAFTISPASNIILLPLITSIEEPAGNGTSLTIYTSSAFSPEELAVTIWGTGTPRREFLHVDDLANACYFLLQNYNEQGIVNIGCGTDLSIKELADLIVEEVGYQGKLIFDTTKPDGTQRKLMDTRKINSLGWKSSINLHVGVKRTVNEVKNLF